MMFYEQYIAALVLGIIALPYIVLAQALQGFNYGSTNQDGSCRGYDDFKSLFTRARTLAGGNGGFTAAHLYTSIQCGTAASPTEAFRAAVDTDTKILVGLWASAGRAGFENELNALIAATRTSFGTAFADRVVAISVGSEDLYRSSPQGVANGEGPGATSAEIQGYIGWMRDWLRGTPLEGKPVTHADTWYFLSFSLCFLFCFALPHLLSYKGIPFHSFFGQILPLHPYHSSYHSKTLASKISSLIGPYLLISL
jgi:glucan endo-1,3-beta-D-glucosidase